MTIEVSDMNSMTHIERLQKTMAVFAMVFIVFGVKILFIKYYGSGVPYWDQWDAEADILYKAYLNSDLSWATLFSSHNEHRILVTRLWSLALFELDGGWDPILQMIVNAALHVGAIVLIVSMASRILRPRDIIPMALFTTFVFVPPIGWENLLAGFQSQFYFLLIFSILSLAGFCSAKAFSLRWWGSLGCSIAAYFSMASGALIGVAAFFVLALQCLLGVRKGVNEYVAAGIVLVASIVMIFYVPHIAGHDELKAHGLRELVDALLSCLKYPQPEHSIGLAVNLPLLGYAFYVLKKRPSFESPHWIVFSLAVWWFGQVLTVAYGRAVAPNSSRYLDITIVALPLNFAVLLFARHAVSFRMQRWLFAATAAWLLITSSGLILTTSKFAVPSVIEKAEQSREEQDNVILYLKTKDLAVLQNKPQLAIPYPSPDRLALLLSDPTIRMALPQVVRPSDVDEASLFERTRLKGRFHRFIERAKASIFNVAPILVGLGIALAFAAGLVRGGREERDGG